MKREHSIGDLVHIPQSVQLVHHDAHPDEDHTQLTIPLDVRETQVPSLGVVTRVPSHGEYITVLCDGVTWSVKNASVYTLSEAWKT